MKDIAEMAVAFVVAFTLTIGACAKQAVTCGETKSPRQEASNVAQSR